MFPYITVIALSIGCDITCHSRISNKIKKCVLIITLGLLAIISGFRRDVGRDYGHYINLFSYITNPSIDRTREEISFRLLIKTLNALGLNARALFLVSGLFLSISLYIFIKNVVAEEYWGFFVFLYICGGSFFSSLNLTRQYIAFSFLLLSMTAFYKSKRAVSILLFAVGCTFHKSLLLFLIIIPLYFFIKHHRTLGPIITIFIGLVLYFICFDQLFHMVGQIVPTWSGYAASSSATERTAASVIKAVTPAILFIYALFQKGGQAYQIHRRDDLLILAGATAYVACSISFAGIMVLTRVTEFFAPLFFILTIKTIQREPSNTRTILYYTIYVYYILLTFVTIFIMNGNDVIPYHASLSL